MEYAGFLYVPCNCSMSNALKHPTIAHVELHPVLIPDKYEQIQTLKMAQAIYPKTACVFVGNLDKTIDDALLGDLVQRAFKKFGQCYVAVFRAHPGKPYAIVQYVIESDAQHAASNGQGIFIASDRAVRVELSRKV